MKQQDSCKLIVLIGRGSPALMDVGSRKIASSNVNLPTRAELFKRSLPTGGGRQHRHGMLLQRMVLKLD